MVEVIKVGKKVYHEVKCAHCNSLLKFTRLDERCSTGRDMSGEPTTDYAIVCPVCNSVVPTRCFTNQGAFVWSKPVEVGGCDDE